MPSRHDTIAALATPAGTAAIALLRISGPDTAGIVAALAGRAPLPRRARHGDYRALDGAVLDDVVVTFFAGPRSYTGEDTAEIACHGNPFIAQRILEDLYRRGCRPAAPGEFTQRAFLNGRMDLSQAEAVMDLIHARGERALAAANQQLRGALSRRMGGLVDQLLAVLAQVEAYIDFPDEDLPAENRDRLLVALAKLLADTSNTLATAHYGEILRDGIKTLIVGMPNVGKSSLLNQLLGQERALVSSEPGTTRDFIEERWLVGPHCVRLIDTAGLNPSPADLERLGMEKTMERAAEADLFLVVLDAAGRRDVPDAIRARLTPQNAIVVLNKSDLVPDAPYPAWAADFPVLRTSALCGSGLDALQRAIVTLADGFQTTVGNEQVAVSARHAHALAEARTALQDATEKLRHQQPSELLASDLRVALSAFGEITGKVDNERMLDRLFATFCIGK